MARPVDPFLDDTCGTPWVMTRLGLAILAIVGITLILCA